MSYLTTLGGTMGSLRYAHDLIEYRGRCTTIPWWDSSHALDAYHNNPPVAQTMVDDEGDDRINPEEIK